jgi:ketol-acid reductoisomerase
VSTFYQDRDAPPDALSGLTVAVVGYGNLGRSMALNLRDSGVPVLVGNRDDECRAAAESDGFAARDIAGATAAADVVYVLLADEVIPGCFRTEIAPNLRPGAAVCFASGYVLAFGLVEPPAGVDVLLLAPRMLGEEVRRTYQERTGYWSYVAVERDSTGAGRSRLLGLAAAAGALRRGALELSARHEALLDLFVEQGLGSWLGTALQLTFQVGVEAGLPADALVLELYMSGEMARTFQTFAESGFLRSVLGHGYTATFGGFQATLGVDRAAMQTHFEKIFTELDTGRFAERFQQEQDDGYPTVAAIRALTAGDDPMTAAERRVQAATR